MFARSTLVARLATRAFSTSRVSRKIYHESTPQTLDRVLDESRDNDRLVLVDFSAKTLSPILERVATEIDADLVVVDADQEPELVQQYQLSDQVFVQVRGLPTVLGFRDGTLKSKFVGAIPEGQLRRFCDQLRNA
ncbi:hypothetical protein BKA62DRAFT_768398 [Auriculariales sp. MPI-PUGE-AT-0066]|nr:hypothetical protein BKA62DRAFT_768398 [Auriculariales sp. MPI-PUGE-AT-0066]